VVIVRLSVRLSQSYDFKDIVTSFKVSPDGFLCSEVGNVVFSGSLLGLLRVNADSEHLAHVRVVKDFTEYSHLGWEIEAMAVNNFSSLVHFSLLELEEAFIRAFKPVVMDSLPLFFRCDVFI
jgi:hypothetical protein